MYQLIGKNSSDKGEDVVLGSYSSLELATADFLKACKDIENEYVLKDCESGKEIKSV